MKIISHRALLDDATSMPNTINAVKEVKSRGLDVEVDVWGNKDGVLFLGHEIPGEKTPLEFLKDPKIWVHAKNEFALEILYDTEVNYFFQSNDLFSVTSKGYIWAHIESEPIIENAVYCAFNLFQLKQLRKKISSPFGICTDLPLTARDVFNA